MQVRNLGAKIGASILAAGAVLPAMADDAFTTAMTDVTTKVGTYGAALVGLAALGVGFGVAIKYVRKIRSAS